MNHDKDSLGAGPKVNIGILVGVLAWTTACSSNNAGTLPFDGGLGGTGTGGMTGGTGGRAGTGGTGGSPDAGPPGIDAPVAIACKSDLQCTPAGLLCDIKQERCVQCLSSLQCKGDEQCSGGSCIKITKCTNSLDCAGLSGGLTICDESFGECVACAKAADCPMNHDCIGQKCVSYTPCKDSLDCPQGTVCEVQIGRCYQCTRDADCGTGRVCAGNACRPACMSDNQCTSQGLLCNVQAGYCAECLKDDDCPTSQYCGAGQCRPDVCRAGSSRCMGNAAQSCNTAGSGFDPVRPCANRQTCTASAGVASCKNWACTADTTECVDRAIVACSKDGLREISRVDCAAMNGKYCSNAACGDRVCTPDQRHCYMDDVYLCDSTGINRSLVSNCATTQYCDAQAVPPVCKAQVCTPLQPTCNGSTATTCTPNGSGYEPGGVDCASNGNRCVTGQCVAPSCTDKIQNQGETDVDCGGTTNCPRCDDFRTCGGPSDCTTNACTMGFCGTIGCQTFGTSSGYIGCERTVQVNLLPCPDIQLTGTRTAVGNDSSVAVALPFSFTFYGVPRTSVQIASSGAMTFNGTTASYNNACIPSAGNPLIAAFWEHFHPNGNVYYQTMGVMPSRQFVVQWYSTIWASGSGIIDVRTVLHEGSNDIEVCYAATTSGAAADTQGLSATAGIQDGAAAALQYSCNAAKLTDGLVLTYNAP